MVKIYLTFFSIFFFLVTGCSRIIEPPIGKFYIALFITNTLDYNIYAEALFLPLTNNNIDGRLAGSNYVSYSEPIEILPGEMKQVMDYIFPNMLKIYKESLDNTPLVFYIEDYYYNTKYLDSYFFILERKSENEIKDDRYLNENAPFSYMPLGCDYGQVIHDLETRKKWFSRYSEGRAFIECIAPNKYNDIFKK